MRAETDSGTTVQPVPSMVSATQEENGSCSISEGNIKMLQAFFKKKLGNILVI